MSLVCRRETSLKYHPSHRPNPSIGGKARERRLQSVVGLGKETDAGAHGLLKDDISD